MKNVTVVIPVFSDSRKYVSKIPILKRVLIGLSCQTDREFDVVVVDNCSYDNILDLVNNFYPAAKYIQHLYPNHRSGARNFGVKNVKTPYVVFLDEDCIPWPTFIHNWKLFIDTFGSTCVGNGAWYSYWDEPHIGDEFVIETESGWSLDYTAIERECNIVKDYSNYVRQGLVLQENALGLKFISGTQVHSGNFCVSVDIFNRIGGFDEEFEGWGYEDTYFEYIVKKLNIPIWLITSVAVVHQNHRKGEEDLSNKEDRKSADRNKALVEEKMLGRKRSL